MIMDHVLFDVEKIPVDELIPGYDAMSGITHAIVKTDVDKILSFRSEDYALIRNAEIIDTFSKHFEAEGIKFNVSATNYRDVRFRITFDLAQHHKRVLANDDVVMSFYINNSYNGSWKYQFGVWVKRLICSNGLTIMLADSKMNMLHTPGADEGIAVEKSIKLIEDFIPRFDDAMDPFYELADQTLENLPEVNARIDEVIEETGFPVGMAENARARAFEEVTNLKLEPSDWIVYNALNYVLNHEAETLMGRKADKIDREALDYLIAY